MDPGHGASRDVKQPKWIAFGVPYTDAVILATVSKDRLSGMIYDPLINRPPEPWSHDCPHCQKDTSTRWPLKARKALRMLRLARVSRNGIWEVELAPNYTFRGKLGKGWKGTVECYNGKSTHDQAGSREAPGTNSRCQGEPHIQDGQASPQTDPDGPPAAGQ